MEKIDFGKCISKISEKGLEKTNILIVGKKGVGKSTLINAVFHDNLTDTGTDEPHTQNIREITKVGIPISLFDTKGLEIKDYKRIISELENFIRKRRNEQDPNKKIHVAWVCIQENSARVEDAEIEFTEMLYKYRIPIIVVLTKAMTDNGFTTKIKELLPRTKNTIRVRAIETSLNENTKLPTLNLAQLIDLTSEVLPEGIENTFAPLLKASSKQDSSRAQKIVVGSVAAAAAVGAIPIPFSDAAILVPIQIGMFTGISKVFGLELSRSFIGSLVSAAIGSSAAMIGGKAIVSGLLKCIPGIGSLAGAVISSTTAATLTTIIGETYIATLSSLLKKNNDEPLKLKDIQKSFKAELKTKK